MKAKKKLSTEMKDCFFIYGVNYNESRCDDWTLLAFSFDLAEAKEKCKLAEKVFSTDAQSYSRRYDEFLLIVGESSEEKAEELKTKDSLSYVSSRQALLAKDNYKVG